MDTELDPQILITVKDRDGTLLLRIYLPTHEDYKTSREMLDTLVIEKTLSV